MGRCVLPKFGAKFCHDRSAAIQSTTPAARSLSTFGGRHFLPTALT